MTYPIIYLWFFLALIAGYFIGSGICMLLMLPIKKHSINKKKKKTENDVVPQEKETKEERQGVLERRLIDKTDSWTDFNCAADSIDSEKYIKERRKTQDRAYQYVKKKIEKSK